MTETDLNIIGSILMLLTVVGSLIVISSQRQKLDDPNDDSVVYLEQIEKISKLSGDAQFALVIYRQSGGIHKNYIFDSASEAIKQAISTFRRAKIEYVVIELYEEFRLSFRRGYHSHKGRNEGKKIGSVEIRHGRHVVENGKNIFYFNQD